MVQKLNLQPVERRAQAIAEAGNNTFLLKNEDIFLDMLTDSELTFVISRSQSMSLWMKISTLIQKVKMIWTISRNRRINNGLYQHKGKRP